MELALWKKRPRTAVATTTMTMTMTIGDDDDDKLLYLILLVKTCSLSKITRVPYFRPIASHFRNQYCHFI